jgi:outer membrane protein assembly factor BamA
VPIRVTVAESLPRRLTVGIGYGTEERARGRIEWTHNNFMGGARQATFSARASFLDQGVSITLVQPRIRRTGLTFSFTGLAERTRQLSYDWESYGGRVSATYRLDRSRPNIVGTGAGRGQHYDFTAGYIHEYQRYGIAADSLDDLSRRDERIALGLDPITGRAAGTLAALDFDIQRVDVNNLVQPTRGLVTSLHVEHAAPWLLGTYKFTEVMADARGYVPIGTSVLAARAQVGTVAASDPTTIPFSHRYFLGGATTLRGWGRYQVSPLDQNGLPIGGRTLVYLSTEFRFPIRGKIAAVGFVDAGNVGRSDLSSSQSPLRFDVGPGLRYQTPVGAIRADLGFQLNPIPGLIVNGKPETRHWRVHFSIGQTF